MKLDNKFPSIDHLEDEARRRIPPFAFDFLVGGLGTDRCVARNRDALDQVMLRPRYLTSMEQPDLGRRLWGHRYEMPFGIAPMGLDGLVWPGAALGLARSANLFNIPFCLSSYSTTRLEIFSSMDPALKWFQYYQPREREVEKDLITRARRAGYETLVVTIDVPTAARRPRDIRNGLSVPPNLSLSTIGQALSRPAWLWEVLKVGEPHFENLASYLPKGVKLAELSQRLDALMDCHVSPDDLRRLRDSWKGLLVVKGILDPADAALCQEIGVDGLVVSNHGGRQLEAAPHPLSVLPEIKAAAGSVSILVDSGVRSGLDILRLLAHGADFVLVGRAFLLGIGALGRNGGDHVITILREEMRTTMSQIGCPTLDQLPAFLDPPRTPAAPLDDRAIPLEKASS